MVESKLVAEEEPDYKYIVSLKNTARARKLIARYPKKYEFINPEHVTCVLDKKSPTSNFYAKVSLVPPWLEPLLGYGIIIQLPECNWSKLSKHAKLLVLMHELEHVVPDLGLRDFDKPYKLTKHNVQEFSVFIEQFGLHWVHRKDLPNPLKEKVKIATSNTSAPVLG